jgi:phenolic acid decarboxylase
VTQSDGIASFDKTTISYTYDNGWSFTNTFDGHLRISHVPRGELREHVEITKLRDGLFFVSWIDDEMGLLSQIIDFETDTVLAAIPVDGEPRTQILTGQITDRGE